jgi:hypothetical protein
VTGTSRTHRARSVHTFSTVARTREDGGKANGTSRWASQQEGHALRAQSGTQRALTASEPGSWNRLQKRGVRALDSEAKALTVTPPQPASAAAHATRSHHCSATAGLRIESKLAYAPKSEPLLEAPEARNVVLQAVHIYQCGCMVKRLQEGLLGSAS